MIEVPSCHEFTSSSIDYSEEDLSNSTIQSCTQDIDTYKIFSSKKQFMLFFWLVITSNLITK